MAAGVSIMMRKPLPLLLAILVPWTLCPEAASLAGHVDQWQSAFSDGPAHNMTDQEDGYTCPTDDCTCYKVNELIWAQCTVPYVGTHLKKLFRLLEARRTGYLVLTCSYTLLQVLDTVPDSSLWDGAFYQLTALRVLALQNCRFKTLSRDYFRNLIHLKELYVQNAVLEHLDPALLAHLPRLQTLEISYSAVDDMPPLCTTSPLRVLNISGNHLSTLEDAGVWCPDQPLIHLETLDVNNNFLSEVPQWLPQAVPNLHHLAIADNYIEVSDPTSFREFPKLAFLDIVNNSFTGFHPRYFQGCKNLLTLGLSQNEVPFLPQDLLSNLTHLMLLGVSEMGLSDQLWQEVAGLSHLQHLNASHNSLTSIDGDVMSHFLVLKYLYLNHNKITSVLTNTFMYQFQLQYLALSFNQIQDIPKFAFSNQNELNTLLLDHNNISLIGFNAFSSLKELLILDLSFNSISILPPHIFSSLFSVSSLNISNNQLTILEGDIFDYTDGMKHLNLSHNSLKYLPVLNNLKDLETVDLGYNNITVLSQATFVNLQNLITVIATHNSLTELPVKIFEGCSNIAHLDLSYNLIEQLGEHVFSSTVFIQTLELSHNRISDITSVFGGMKRLMYLNLSYNKLTKVLRGHFPHTLSHIDLSHNDIAFISAHTFKSLSHLRTVDLSYNQLTKISKMAVEIAFNLPYHPSFLIDFNPFLCDCHLGWLKDWLEGRLKDIVPLPNVRNAVGLRCSSPFQTKRVPIHVIPRSEFLCNYSSHCEESCMCCDYESCYCKYTCPSGCHCYIGDDYLHVHHVLCDSAQLTAIPQVLPEGATDLRLDGNTIHTIHRHAFLALKHVKTMYLNHSLIDTIQNNSFIGLKSVEALYLHDNHITVIYSVTFDGLESLQRLYLQNNDIVFIDQQALLNPNSLALVNLQGNALVTTSTEELAELVNRSLSREVRAQLYLSGNPWTCESYFACKLLQLLISFSNSVDDISYVECLSPAGKDGSIQPHTGGLLLLDLQHSVCAENVTGSGNVTIQTVDNTRGPTETYALIAACVVIAFAVALLIIAYFNRHLLQVLCFTRFGCRVFKMARPSDDDERPYDAFISYSNKDEDFVTRQLAPRLENGDRKFRLCVHYRDFPVGACFAETIVRSVEASKRTILVVSDNFLDCEWCRFAFQTANQQVLNERRNRVILILMHDLDRARLDNTLRAYMRTRTYLKYDDPWFWEKLMFSMPDIRYRAKMAANHQNHHNPHRQHQQQHGELANRLPSSRELEYLARRLSEQQAPASERETVHNYMYETPVLETRHSLDYQLANGCSPSPHHTNCGFRHSDYNSSDSTSGYHNGSMNSSCCAHYEEVGPPVSWSLQSTPLRQKAVAPPLPSIPKEGLVPGGCMRTVPV